MLKKWFVGLVACASLFSVRAAAAEKIDFDQGVNVKQVIETVRAEVASQKDKTASWTIMVFVNAKNNLEKYGLMNVNQMEMVGSSDKVKIAVELGRMGTYDSSDGGWKGERRYIIEKDNNASHISSPVLQNIPKADMGDWRHLVDFVKWAQAKAPAQRYMLIVWNHGSGWDLPRGGFSTRGISYDDETGHHISTEDLGKALASLGKIDVYGSDACLMQMAEVDYQIKDSVDYIVGSEETEAGDGYTYDKLLGPIVGNPSMASAELATLAAQAYTDHYIPLGQGATQSAVRAAALPQLLLAINDWTGAVMAANEADVVKTAHSAAQSFYYSDNKDLLDFVQRVDGATKNDAVSGKGRALEKLLSEQVIVHNAATGDAYANAKGLAVYLPDSGYNSSYDDLAWAKDGRWAQFAQWVGGLK